MRRKSLSAKIARYTRTFRMRLGLASEVLQSPGALPFRPSIRTVSISKRVAAIDGDLRRLITGWNQHLPQILAVVAEARQVVHREELSRKDIAEIKQALTTLDAAIVAMASRLDRIEASVRAASGDGE